MSLLHRLVLYGVLIASSAATADEGKDVKRLQSESRALFARILAKAPAVAPCSLDSAWMQYAAPADIGRKYFGVTVHAELSAWNLISASPQQILDPQNAMDGAFCDSAQRIARRKALRDSGAESAEPWRASEYLEREYAVPVFDRAFHLAIVVAGNNHCREYRREAAATPVMTCEGGVWAEVWRKRRGGWRSVEAINIATWQ